MSSQPGTSDSFADRLTPAGLMHKRCRATSGAIMRKLMACRLSESTLVMQEQQLRVHREERGGP